MLIVPRAVVKECSATADTQRKRGRNAMQPNGLMLKMLEGMIPPETRERAKAAFEALVKTGRAEGSFEVPGIGPCRVLIEKLPLNIPAKGSE